MPLLIIIFLSLCVCSSFAEMAFQEKDGIVFMKNEATSRTLSLTRVSAKVTKPGKYTLEVVHPIPEGNDNLSAKATLNGRSIGGGSERKYLINDGIVSSFQKPLDIYTAGKYTIEITCDVPPSWVRLVPHIYDQSRIKVGSKNYYDQWKVLSKSPEKQAGMEWFQEAKFGMFVHWGVYSVAAGSWKGVKIEDTQTKGPKVAEWLMHAFQISRKDYKAFAEQFEPDSSFARNFVTLARKTGMKYLVITAKHHDGFALFDSQHSDFDIADSTLYGGDLIKELYEECLRGGIGFGVYYSHGHDWMDGTDGNYATEKAFRDQLGLFTRPNGKNFWDPSQNDFDDYLENKAFPQIHELVKMFPKMKLIWFDGDGLISEYDAFRFYKEIYDLNPNIIVNRRIGYEYGDYMDAGDNRTPKAGELAPKYFETCGTANHSWGYKAHDNDWKTSGELLRNFVDIISKGGNYLLNIGPDGKGRIPEECAKNFAKMGKWVKANGDAIYGTSRWKIYNENVQKARNAVNAEGEFWFSAKGNKVYAMTLAAAPEVVEIKSLNSSAGKITSLRLLTGTELENWKQSDKYLTINFKDVLIRDSGYVLEATFSKPQAKD